ncbi:hypothetical protein KY314_04015 [Candidatus Woesearchaeota archaeon]|nr:hypothetical protein [Candidatus Woesearchaeota archaeon]
MIKQFTNDNIDKVVEGIFNKIKKTADHHGVVFTPIKVDGNFDQVEIKFEANIVTNKCAEPYRYFNKKNLKEFRKAISYWLNKYSKENGTDAILKNISFDQKMFRSKIIVTISDKKEDIAKRHLATIGMEHLYNKRFSYKGNSYIIIDANPRAKKYPVICESQFDKIQIRFSKAYVRKTFSDGQ